jgi:hypothetical protein
MQQGLTDEQLEANFIASVEFSANAGGTDKLRVHWTAALAAYNDSDSLHAKGLAVDANSQKA